VQKCFCGVCKVAFRFAWTPKLICEVCTVSFQKCVGDSVDSEGNLWGMQRWEWIVSESAAGILWIPKVICVGVYRFGSAAGILWSPKLFCRTDKVIEFFYLVSVCPHSSTFPRSLSHDENSANRHQLLIHSYFSPSTSMNYMRQLRSYNSSRMNVIPSKSQDIIPIDARMEFRYQYIFDCRNYSDLQHRISQKW
jgi:hypothetical protein